MVFRSAFQCSSVLLFRFPIYITNDRNINYYLMNGGSVLTFELQSQPRHRIDLTPVHTETMLETLFQGQVVCRVLLYALAYIISPLLHSHL
jgi:hypothetical protein